MSMNSPQAMLDAYWMPFTANRQFKAAPRLLVQASGMFYRSDDGREILDGNQLRELDYAPSFQMGHPLAFEIS